MTKKATIIISLVEESKEVPNEQIEMEIFEELSKVPPKVQWLKEVKKVTVTEET